MLDLSEAKYQLTDDFPRDVDCYNNVHTGTSIIYDITLLFKDTCFERYGTKNWSGPGMESKISSTQSHILPQ